MKINRLFLAAALLTGTAVSSSAASLSWTGALPGTWDTTTANWSDGTNTLAWPSTSSGSDVATFGGTGGPVTLSGNIFANALNFNATGYTLSSGTLTLDGTTPTITTGTSVTTTINSIVAGSAGLTNAGTGTLVLGGTNTFTGGVNLSGGTLQIASAGNISSGNALTFTNNAVLNTTTGITLANNVVIAAGQSGTIRATSGVTTLTGDYSGVAGTLTLDVSGNTTNYGGIFINTASQVAGAVVNLLGSSGTNVQLGMNNANAQTFFANTKLVISTTGSGVTYITGGNGLNNLNLQFGALDGGNASTLIGFDNKTGTVTINGTTDGNFAGVIFDGNNGGYTPLANLTKKGSSTQTLSGNNTYTGATTINGGVLSLTSTGQLSGTSAINIAGATLQTASLSNIRSAATLTLSDGGLLDYTANATGTLANKVIVAAGQSATIRMAAGSGGQKTVNLSGDYSGMLGTLTLDMSGNSGYSGFISSSNAGPAGTVQVIGATGANWSQLGGAGTNFWANTVLNLPSSGNVYLNGTTTSWTFGALSGGNANTKIGFDNASGKTVTINGISDANYSGIIFNGGGSAGPNGLVKNGSSTQTLSGANTYSGGTTINAGTLAIAGSGKLGATTGALTLNGGTLDLSAATAQTVGALSLGAASIVNTGTTAGALNINGTVTLTALGAKLTNSGATGTLHFASSSLNLGGIFDSGYNGAAYTLISGASNANFTTITGSTVWNVTFNNATGMLTFTAVPEPAAYGLLGAGALAGLAFARRRRPRSV